MEVPKSLYAVLMSSLISSYMVSLDYKLMPGLLINQEAFDTKLCACQGIDEWATQLTIFYLDSYLLKLITFFIMWKLHLEVLKEYNL